MRTNVKLTIGATLSFVFLCIARAFGQTNAAAIVDPASIHTGVEINVVTAAYHQLLNNPASVSVIPVLCVIAYFCDHLPFINQKYTADITILAGAAIYWLYALPASVPKNFPYPAVVLASNGLLCGFLASIVHRQAVARFIALYQGRSGAVCARCGKSLAVPQQPNNQNEN